MRIRLADHLRLTNAESWLAESSRGKRQGDAVVLVGIDTLFDGRLAALTIPIKFLAIDIVQHETHLAHLRLHGLYAVGLLDFQR